MCNGIQRLSGAVRFSGDNVLPHTQNVPETFLGSLIRERKVSPLPTQDSDEQFMRLALQQAHMALEEDQLPIGAVIIHQNVAISAGRNQVELKQTDLAHAELEAMLPVQAFLSAHAQECDIYTTLEPCMMCFGAIVNFHFRRLVVAAPDRLVGALSLIPHAPYYMRRAPAITTGVLADESRAIIEQYVARTNLRSHLLSSIH